jgi:hypothetical protein
MNVKLPLMRLLWLRVLSYEIYVPRYDNYLLVLLIIQNYIQRRLVSAILRTNRYSATNAE